MGQRKQLESLDLVFWILLQAAVPPTAHVSGRKARHSALLAAAPFLVTSIYEMSVICIRQLIYKEGV